MSSQTNSMGTPIFSPYGQGMLPGFGGGDIPSNPYNTGVGYATNLTQPFNDTQQSANLVTTNGVTQQVQPPNTSSGSNNSSSNSSGDTTNPYSNSNAVSLLSQTVSKSGQGQSVLGTLTNSVNNLGASSGLFAAAPAAETVSPAVAAADAASTASFAGTTEAAMGTTGLATSATGTSAAGGIMGGATLSGVMGAAGLGALGGSILAGAIGGNKTGGAIGGGIGAAAMAFGGAGAAAMGLELGAMAGPIGALVGGVGGALFGSMFGGSGTPTNSSGESGTLTASGALSNIGTGSKNPNGTSNATVAANIQNFSGVAEAASTALGIKFSPDVKFSTVYSSQHGGNTMQVIDTKTGQSTPFTFNSSNPAASQAAFSQALVAAAKYSGYTDTSQITDWFNNTYVNNQAGASNQPPTLPNNPTPSGSNAWGAFLNSYNAQQNAGAASTQTTVGGKSVSSYPTQGTTNANASPGPVAGTAT